MVVVVTAVRPPFRSSLADLPRPHREPSFSYPPGRAATVQMVCMVAARRMRMKKWV